MTLTQMKHPRGRNAFLVARFALVLSALAIGAIAGCGGGSNPGSDNAPTTTPPATTTPSTPAPDTTPSAPSAGESESAEVMGQRVYTTRCALCHGPQGRGDGPGAAALNPKPRNYHDKTYMATRTDAELLEVIRNGKGSMPKWGAILSEAEIKAVLQHVRGLGAKP